ncbi:iron chaperone [Streptomyces sp. NPDC059917]|uniref:iron chaperone n=1 Tax=Streptomyces sp. NPDC059917 TaxID=3347002 RepID=UPI00365FD0B9
MPSTKSPADAPATTEKYDGFTAEERAAMKDHAREEKKAAARRGTSRAQKAAAEARDVLAKIAEMPDADRVLAERIHEIVTTAAPDLAPKLWYGMPAYARDGKVVCHFQSAAKFTSRYATLGFSDQAALDDGSVWATSYAVRELTAADEERIGALVEKAVGRAAA